METQKALELSFFGALLDDPQKIIATALSDGVSDDWFTDDRCRAMWKACVALWSTKSDGEELDSLAIIDEAARIVRREPEEYGGVQINTDFYDEAVKYATNEAQVGGFIPKLRNSATDRRLRQAMQKAEKDLSENGNATDAAGSLMQDITSIQAAAMVVKDEGVYDLTMQNIAEWERARHEVADNHNADFTIGLPLPFKTLAKKMRGLQVGMNVIAARPSVGKTSFGFQLAIHLVKQGYHVGFNSLDMPTGQLMKRPVSYLSQVPLEPLDNGWATQDQMAKVKQQAEVIRGWQRDGLLSLTSRRSVHDFKSWCTVMHSEGKLDVVFVDYIQKLSAGKGFYGESAMKQVSSIVSSIAQELKIPVVALAQLNRANEKAEGGEREPKISDIRESGAIEQDAFTIILLYRDIGVTKAWEAEKPSILDPLKERFNGESLKPVWVDLAKSQNGGRIKIPFVVYEDTFTWYEGDRKAKSGSGAGANKPKFMRIVPDGRNPELEKMLGLARCLVTEEGEDIKSDDSISEAPAQGGEPSDWDAMDEPGDLFPGGNGSIVTTDPMV